MSLQKLITDLEVAKLEFEQDFKEAKETNNPLANIWNGYSGGIALSIRYLKLHMEEEGYLEEDVFQEEDAV